MNTAGLSFLGAKAKPAAEAIARWCEREGVGIEFIKRGGHPAAVLSFNRQSRKVFFSSTASDHRALENILQTCRKEARNMGWEPQKETVMETTVLKSFADLPKVPEPEPHRVEIRLEKPAAPEPTCPKPPARFAGKMLSGGIEDYELTKAIKRRNAWIAEQKDAGQSANDIYLEVVAAGWHMKSSANIYAVLSTMRQRNGTAKPREEMRAAKTARPEPERVHITAEPAIDPLVFAIAEAIAPLIREQLAKQSKALEAMKAKADKWDAISGLVREA